MGQGVGNGGWAGSISYPALAAALAAGYATASTDTGHVGNTAAFAIGHPETLVDIRDVLSQDAVEKILTRAEEADGGDRRPEGLQILRKEALPEILAQREEEDSPGDRDDVALETERLRSGSHVGLDTTMKLLFHSQA